MVQRVPGDRPSSFVVCLSPAATRQTTRNDRLSHLPRNRPASLPYCTGSVAASVVLPPTLSEIGTADPVVALAGTVTAT